MKTKIISSRFLYEATDQLSSRFLREATGTHVRSACGGSRFNQCPTNFSFSSERHKLRLVDIKPIHYHSLTFVVAGNDLSLIDQADVTQW